MNVSQKEKGFTIIEVVLVLAIAGLIFLMVFIALPALQRNQRDTQRRNDLSRAQTAVQSYQTNNRNSLPTNWDTFKTQYLLAGGDTFQDPSGKDYVFTASEVGAAVPTTVDATDANQSNVRIYYTKEAVCGDDGDVKGGQGARKVALRIVLEGGGVSCVNN